MYKKHDFFCPVVKWLTSGFVCTAVSLNWFICHLQTFEKFDTKAYINRLTLGTFCKKCLFWTFWWFLGWISAKLALIWPKMHFATRQLAFLAIGIVFYNISTWACAFRFLRFFFSHFVFLLFFSFYCSD